MQNQQQQKQQQQKNVTKTMLWIWIEGFDNIIPLTQDYEANTYSVAPMQK